MWKKEKLCGISIAKQTRKSLALQMLPDSPRCHHILIPQTASRPSERYSTVRVPSRASFHSKLEVPGDEVGSNLSTRPEAPSCGGSSSPSCQHHLLAGNPLTVTVHELILRSLTASGKFKKADKES